MTRAMIARKQQNIKRKREKEKEIIKENKRGEKRKGENVNEEKRGERKRKIRSF